jgi:2'-5' RNA ligase
MRVFVGLKVAPNIAIELARFAKPIEQPSVRLVAPQDIHLTLVPPWHEDSIPPVIDRLRGTAASFDAFDLTFDRVGYGPQPRRPRLLWAECVAEESITGLYAALMEAFGRSSDRPFKPHVTLARIRSGGGAVARKHPVDQPIALKQRVDTVELFRSPAHGTTGYQVLASLPLGELNPS